MTLTEHKGSTQLREGTWVEFPSETIPPNCCSQFGVHNSGFFQGTMGDVRYSFPPLEGLVHFKWNHPGVSLQGHLSCTGLNRLQGNRISVYTHIKALNEASAYFHVVDTQNTPNIVLLAARAVPPLAAAGPSSRRHASGSDYWSDSKTAASAGDRRALLQAGYDVLRPLAEALRIPSTAQGALSVVCKEVHLVSPRAFFCNIVSSASKGGVAYKSLSSNCKLWLEWAIGCERFDRTWDPDEHVDLHSAVVGGIEDSGLVMAAEVDSLRRVAPFELTGDAVGVGGLSGSEWGQFDGMDPFNGGAPANNEEEDLMIGVATARRTGIDRVPASAPASAAALQLAASMEAVLAAMRLFAKGVGPVVEAELKSRHGKEWLRYCDLPPGHIWRVSRPEEYQQGGDLVVPPTRRDSRSASAAQPAYEIDAEGLLHVINRQWDECFCNKNMERRALQVVQRGCVFWGGQEVQMFDFEFVLHFVSAVKEILNGVRATHQCKEIDRLIRRLYSSAAVASSIASTSSHPSSTPPPPPPALEPTQMSAAEYSAPPGSGPAYAALPTRPSSSGGDPPMFASPIRIADSPFSGF
eukprot:GHVU01212235.1.p1 GENE.GHVU01212235.1~~GHVU01212235.1.p1  ORF type:complete len:637 (-),score=135.02 GHVU01212235.1:675-2414(-)